MIVLFVLQSIVQSYLAIVVLSWVLIPTSGMRTCSFRRKKMMNDNFCPKTPFSSSCSGSRCTWMWVSGSELENWCKTKRRKKMKRTPLFIIPGSASFPCQFVFNRLCNSYTDTQWQINFYCYDLTGHLISKRHLRHRCSRIKIKCKKNYKNVVKYFEIWKNIVKCCKVS